MSVDTNIISWCYLNVNIDICVDSLSIRDNVSKIDFEWSIFIDWFDNAMIDFEWLISIFEWLISLNWMNDWMIWSIMND